MICSTSCTFSAFGYFWSDLPILRQQVGLEEVQQRRRPRANAIKHFYLSLTAGWWMWEAGGACFKVL
jgi:hypothetical protein